jgi:hypothetical protein
VSRDGFTRADVDTRFYSDPKIVALARLLRDPLKTAAFAALYDALVRASWAAGRRLTLEESLPAWWLDPPDEPRAALVAVGLLGDDGRVVEHAWASWFLPAAERVADAKIAGMVGGLMRSLGLSKEEAVKEARRRVARADLGEPRVPPSPTDQPTDVPADRPRRDGHAGAREKTPTDPEPTDTPKNGHDRTFERRRQDAIDHIRDGSYSGLAAKRAMRDYGIDPQEISP